MCLVRCDGVLLERGACYLQRAEAPARGADAPLPTERTLRAGPVSAGAADRRWIYPGCSRGEAERGELAPVRASREGGLRLRPGGWLALEGNPAGLASLRLHPDSLLPQPRGSREHRPL